MLTYTINLNPVVQMTDDQFYELCRSNPDIKFERTAQGELVIMPPMGGETGINNSEINADFVIWNRHTEQGYVFDSSTCFKLPNGGNRAPDVAWIRRDRWNTLTPDQKRKFPPIAPDFVLELLSPTDTLKEVQAKMQEYMSAGVRLGWLIDPKTRRVEIYRQGQPPEVLEAPTQLSGGEVLPGFQLNLQRIW
jgi:Uma2 family endonuclease